MPEPEKTPCPICNGGEVVYLNESEVEMCRCLKARLLRKHLGPEISSAPTILESPLLRVVKDEVLVDRTTENLFLKTAWVTLLSHLKWVLYCKGTRFRFSMITDEKIRTVFVGNESYNSRARGKRDEMETFNSLGDLVGADYDLVIIRLGRLGHKNIAAPGALKEALMLREAACLPTWIVEEEGYDFGEGCFSYSQDVGDYIYRIFTTVRLELDSSVPVRRRLEPEDDVSVEDVSANADPAEMMPPRPSTPIVSRYQAPASQDEDDLPGGGAKKKWTSGKKRNSGGPV